MNLEKHEFPGLIKISSTEVDICGITLPRNMKPPFCNLKESEFTDFDKDRHFLDLLRRLAINKKHGQHICLMSAPGVGKTDVLKYFGFLLNIPVVLLSCSEETKATELEGKYVPNTKDARTFFEDKMSPLKRHLLKDSSKKILEEVEVAFQAFIAKQNVHKEKESVTPEEEQRLQGLKEEMDTMRKSANEQIIKNEGWNLENIEWTFSPGVLPRAIEDNAMLILDEWNKVSPGVRELLNAVIAKPNHPETYGTSKFVSYANGGGEYVLGDQFMVMAAVNFPDPASARYPFHEAEMRRLDLQILEKLSSKEAINRNVGKRMKYAPTSRQEDITELKKKFALRLRATPLPLESDRSLESLVDMTKSIIEQAAHVIEQVGVRQAQEITLVGARDIIFDFLFNVQFKDFPEGILFALDHYFLNKIVDPDKRREVKTKIEQIVTMGDFKKKISQIIKIYDEEAAFSKEILATMENIRALLNEKDILKGIAQLCKVVRRHYSSLLNREKTVDSELEFLEECVTLHGGKASYFKEIEKNITTLNGWLNEYTIRKKQEAVYTAFADETAQFLSSVKTPSTNPSEKPTETEVQKLSFKEINKDLEALSATGEMTYYAPSKINKNLKKFGITISTTELRRMESVIASDNWAVDLKEVIDKCKNLRKYTMGKKPPLLLVLPKEIVLGGKTVPFTIEQLEKSIWTGVDKTKWKEERTGNLMHLNITSFLPESSKKKQYGAALVAYTSASIEGSENKKYPEQEELVRKIFGINSKIEADVYLAMVLHYLQTEEVLMSEGWMRLHEIGTDGVPIGVSDIDRKLGLLSNDLNAYDDAGIGSSFVFSSYTKAPEGRP